MDIRSRSRPYAWSMVGTDAVDWRRSPIMKPKVIKAWGVVSAVSGNMIDIWPTREKAKAAKLTHERIVRLEYSILPNRKAR